MRPEVTYDPQIDCLYVRLSHLPIAHTDYLDDLRGIDYSADNAVVGIEFIDASAGIDLSYVPFRQKVEEAIGDSGFSLRVRVEP